MHIEKIPFQLGYTINDLFLASPFVKVIAAGVSAILGLIVTGHESILTLIFIVYTIDFITGVAKALKHRVFCSTKFFKGAVKLLVYGVFILIGAGLDIILKTGMMFTNFFFAYMFITDAISILENLEEFGFNVPIFFVKFLQVRRQKLMDAFDQTLTPAERSILSQAEDIKSKKKSLPIQFEHPISETV